MSKQSYIRGFAKKAAERGIDPEALAKLVLSKSAQDAGADDWKTKSKELWAKVMEKIDAAKSWYNKEMPEAAKDLLAAGVGAGVGTGIGAAVKGKKGLVPGAIIGGLGGGALRRVSDEQWKAVMDYLTKSKAKQQASQNAVKSVKVT